MNVLYLENCIFKLIIFNSNTKKKLERHEMWDEYSKDTKKDLQHFI